jgi:hypothetical protein
VDHHATELAVRPHTLSIVDSRPSGSCHRPAALTVPGTESRRPWLRQANATPEGPRRHRRLRRRHQGNHRSVALLERLATPVEGNVGAQDAAVRSWAGRSRPRPRTGQPHVRPGVWRGPLR